jgi:alkaline phosphatase
MKKKIMFLLLVSVFSFSLFSEGTKEVALSTENNSTKSVKNVILLVGDGMSVAQIATTDAFIGAQKGHYISKLNFENFNHQGLTSTYAGDRLITDSAAAGTALATGSKTYCGAISVDMNKNELKTILEYAQDNNKSTGIVTSTRVTHATPAVFLSKNIDRNAENEIAEDEAYSGVDFLAGGGYRYFVSKDNDKGLASKRTDGKDLIKEMEKAGYRSFISEEETIDFLNYKPKAGEKIVGLFSYSHLDYAIDDANQPTLAQMTDKALESLSYDNDGFFLMVEGGRIDHACHANDAVTAIEDTLAFEDAVQVAIDFYNKNPNDTLVIVTGDHETGGLTLGFAGTHYESAYEQLQNQKISYEKYGSQYFADYKKSHSISNCNLSDLENDLNYYFGLNNLNDEERTSLQNALKRSVAGEVITGTQESDYLLYGGYEPFIMEITHILNKRAGVAFTSYSHTAVPVATFAIGNGSEKVNGMFDNTDIFNFMLEAMDSTN